MIKLIRIGIVNNKLYAKHSAKAFRYIKRYIKDIKIKEVRLGKESAESPELKLIGSLEKNVIDLAVLKYIDIMHRDDLEDFTVAMVLPGNDTRDILVTRRSLKNNFDYAVVLCFLEDSIEFFKNRFEGVSCIKSDLSEKEMFAALSDKKCDAIVLPYENVKALHLDRLRGFKYMTFDNNYRKDKPDSIWVILSKNTEENHEICSKLIPLSDKENVMILERFKN